MCKPTNCMEDSCRYLLIGGEGITHYYLCEKGYEEYCEEPESNYQDEDWGRY